jgi:DNA-binding NarL/FixJ family response regulator
LEKEIDQIRAALEKNELATKTRRDAQQQALQFLQQDAEREIKFLERKLSEDSTAWNRQLTEREKSVEQLIREGEAGFLQKKEAYEKAGETQSKELALSEQALREQEARLIEERRRWTEAVHAKDQEIITLKQALSRREAELEAELAQQEVHLK